jgi:hypothetical protein
VITAGSEGYVRTSGGAKLGRMSLPTTTVGT